MLGFAVAHRHRSCPARSPFSAFFCISFGRRSLASAGSSPPASSSRSRHVCQWDCTRACSASLRSLDARCAESGAPFRRQSQCCARPPIQRFARVCRSRTGNPRSGSFSESSGDFQNLTDGRRIGQHRRAPGGSRSARGARCVRSRPFAPVRARSRPLAGGCCRVRGHADRG
jgi:hypothetical protein